MDSLFDASNAGLTPVIDGPLSLTHGGRFALNVSKFVHFGYADSQSHNFVNQVRSLSMESVRVYIDFKSPYSYVAVRPLIELAQAEAVALEWRPYTLKLARSHPGAGVDEQLIYSMRKIRYLYQDVRRFATPQGLVIKGPERIFDGTVSSIGMLMAQQQSVFEGYRDIVFERFFKRDLNIDSVQEIGAVLASVGADSSGFADFVTSQGQFQHQAIQAQAESEGVFGVPSMVYRGELFWGGDRIELLRARLRAYRQ